MPSLSLNPSQRATLAALQTAITDAQTRFNIYVTATLDAADVQTPSANVDLAAATVTWADAPDTADPAQLRLEG